MITKLQHLLLRTYFWKSHGAAPETTKVRSPKVPKFTNSQLDGIVITKSGKGIDTISSGIEGAWTQNPIKWDMGYLDCLYGHEWELTKNGWRAITMTPKEMDIKMVPDAHDKIKKHPPMMQTTDISLKVDPSYGPITEH